MKRLRNWLLFIIIVLIWASNWAVMKGGLSYVNPLNFVLHRFIFSTLSMSPLLIALWRNVLRDRNNLVKLFFLAVINTTGMTLTNIGLVHEKSGISAILTYTQPLFVFSMAIPFLNEKMKASRLLAIFIGFLGVVVLSINKMSFLENLAYSIFPLIVGAFLWAVTVVYYKKLLSQIDPVVTNIVQQGVGAILLAPMSVAFGGFFPLSPTYLTIILYSSIGASSVGLTLWLLLLREEEATVLSSSSFIIPMASLFFGWWLLGENIEPTSLLGGALIMIGVYMVNRT